MKIIWCMFSEIWSMTDLFVILGHFLLFYPTNNPNKSKFWKNELKTWIYHHFKQEYQKLWSYAVPFLSYGWQTDGWTEKWHIEVGTLHCFSLKIYGFCSSNALYPESLPSISTRMFDTFDNWDHYYFELNFSLELLIKVFL